MCKCNEVSESKCMVINESVNELVALIKEQSGQYYLEGLEHRWIMKINYCPLCGRELAEEGWW